VITARLWLERDVRRTRSYPSGGWQAANVAGPEGAFGLSPMSSWLLARLRMQAGGPSKSPISKAPSRRIVMTQPTANPVLARLGILVGEWDMQASIGGRPTGRARATFEPLEGGAFVIQHADAVTSEIEVPPEWVANSPFPLTTIIGLDLASDPIPRVAR
jgi:hypothetical protein